MIIQPEYISIDDLAVKLGKRFIGCIFHATEGNL
jgi:hypothetical protein